MVSLVLLGVSSSSLNPWLCLIHLLSRIFTYGVLQRADKSSTYHIHHRISQRSFKFIDCELSRQISEGQSSSKVGTTRSDFAERDSAGDGRLTGPGTAFLPSKYLLLHLDVLSV